MHTYVHANLFIQTNIFQKQFLVIKFQDNIEQDKSC